MLEKNKNNKADAENLNQSGSNDEESGTLEENSTTVGELRIEANLVITPTLRHETMKSITSNKKMIVLHLKYYKMRTLVIISNW